MNVKFIVIQLIHQAFSLENILLNKSHLLFFPHALKRLLLKEIVIIFLLEWTLQKKKQKKVG